ncbi:MAG: proteobacterial dedicated sortase system response regulator [gamma proteobacterium symbiont of Bathyaustriella thionipta]|nr:proteobacterial dedicated sortase system response regulator [gamma proteobacterium symbiont of Bathyaustriella thionipta]
MGKTIIIVEDEDNIRRNYCDMLRRHGYQASGIATRAAAVQAFQQPLPDLVILDIALQDDADAGFELCRLLRNRSDSLPILFLTARDSDIDAVSGLRLGADDYLTKDISLVHLMARISALFRRVDALQNNVSDTAQINNGPLSLNSDQMTVSWNHREIDLTLTEFWLVHSLAKRPGHVRSREQLMEDANIYVDAATISTHIRRIRNKFLKNDAGFDAIEAIYGLGYRWLPHHGSS